MKTFAVLLVLLMVTMGLAQPPDTLWTMSYNYECAFASQDYPYSVRHCWDGGFIIGGECNFVNHQVYSKSIVLRTDARGDSLWLRNLDENNYYPLSRSTDAIQTSDGGFLVSVTGRLSGFNIIKLDANGNEEWADSVERGVCALERTNDGGYIHSGGPTVRKLDSRGDVLWSLNLPDARIVRTVPVAPDGYLAVGTLADDFHLIRISEIGDTLWTRRVGGERREWAYSLCPVPEGGCLAVGYSAPVGSDSTRAYLVRVAASGDTLWTRMFGPWSAAATQVIEAIDGGYILCIRGGWRQRILKVSASGDSVWAMDLGEGEATSVCQASDSGYAVVGGRNYTDFDGIRLVRLTGGAVPVSPWRAILPQSFEISAYPNPFNPTTTLSFTFPKSGVTSIEVYDITGRNVQTLQSGILEAGDHQIAFDGSKLPSGLYLARLQCHEFTVTQKLLLLK